MAGPTSVLVPLGVVVVGGLVHVVVRHVSVVQTRFRAQASWPSESHSSLIKTGELARGHDPLPFKLLHQLVYWLLCFIVSGLKLGPRTQSIGIALLII